MAAGDPTGDDLVSGTTSGDTLPEPWPPDEPELREISFGAGVELTSGVTYAIVVRAADAADADDAGLWQMITDGTGYGGEVHYYSTDGGSTWSSQTPAKVFFKTYANGALRDNCSFDYTGAGAWLYGAAYWSAMTFTASSTYTITSVKLELYRVADSTPGTITVSIKATSSPIKAKTPAPIDTFTGMTLDYQAFSWVSGTETPPDEEVYNVYWGTTSDDLSEIVHQGSATSIAAAFLIVTIGAGLYNETYYWRVDTYWPSTEETAEGDEWWFSTIAFSPPLPTGITLAGGDGDEGDPTGTITGENNMITIRKLVAAARNKIFYEDL